VVEATLTQLGMETLLAGYRNPLDQLDGEYPIKCLNVCQPRWREGKIRMPLWELMRVFGPRMRMGCAAEFVGNQITLHIWSLLTVDELKQMVGG
jgi:hypothetical protein